MMLFANPAAIGWLVGQPSLLPASASLDSYSQTLWALNTTIFECHGEDKIDSH